ncbi:MAG: phosphoesterase [Phycisphaerae bacterium]|nr:MAG: phosphoesterase [Phycisphaerae bacterium]
MKIGILSDTHGQFEITRTAVKLLTDAGAEYLIHCGDVGGTDILDLLAGIPSAFVFGNCDYDQDVLKNYASHLGIECLEIWGILNLSGKRVAVTHGDDTQLISRIMRLTDPVNYLLTGHTHVRYDNRSGPIRCINPGALYRSRLKSVALLDLMQDELQFYQIGVH